MSVILAEKVSQYIAQGICFGLCLVLCVLIVSTQVMVLYSKRIITRIRVTKENTIQVLSYFLFIGQIG